MDSSQNYGVRWKTPEEFRMVKLPKRWEYDNQDGDVNPNSKADNIDNYIPKRFR